MNQEQALSNLAPVYHEEFKQLCQTYLQIDEEVLEAADSCRLSSIGYFVVTTLRTISVLYRDPPPRFLEPAPYYVHKDMLSDGRKWTAYWRPPPIGPLNKASMERRQIEDAHHSRLKRVESKNYKLSYERQDVELTSLICFGSSSRFFGDLTFRAEAGQRIYSLLLKCLRGEISPKTSSSNNQLIVELERLSALYREGLLSSQQFEAAKNKLLL